MSSHHFVKEGQEPAVIIAESLPLDIVEPLLEWAPLVIVFEQALDHVLAWGIKTDVILSTKSSTDELMQKAAHQFPFEIVTAKEATAFDVAIQFLIDKKQRFVVLCVKDASAHFTKGKEVSHAVDLSIIDADAKWALIHAGMFQKWFSTGSVFYLQSDALVETSGDLKELSPESFSVQSDSIVTLKSTSSFWIGESLK
jgi:hypothetical protein